jgi:hypothetical protein
MIGRHAAHERQAVRIEDASVGPEMAEDAFGFEG